MLDVEDTDDEFLQYFSPEEVSITHTPIGFHEHWALDARMEYDKKRRPMLFAKMDNGSCFIVKLWGVDLYRKEWETMERRGELRKYIAGWAGVPEEFDNGGEATGKGKDRQT